MKRIFNKLFLIFILAMCIISTKVYAAGSFSLSASKTTINQGESTTITITGNNAIGQIALSATNGTVSPSSIFLQTASDSKTVTVTSTSSDNIVVTAAPGTGGLGDSDENPITASKNLTIVVNKSASSSDNTATTNNNSSNTNSNNNANSNNNQSNAKTATLMDLWITPKQYDFKGFKPNVPSEVTVPNDVTTITINYKKRNKNQKVTGQTGKQNLNEGLNSFEIKVTESGKENKYIIEVTRKAKEDKKEENKAEENTVVEEVIEQPAFGLSDLKIAGLNMIPQFKTDVYEYRVELRDNLDKLDINAVPGTVNSKIEITGNENLQEGENVITILVQGEKEEETAAYQIIVNKVLATAKVERKIDYIMLGASIVSGTLFFIGCIITIVLVKKNKSNSLYNDEDDDEDEYTNNNYYSNDFYNDNMDSFNNDYNNYGFDNNEKTVDKEEVEEIKNDNNITPENIIENIYNKMANMYNDDENKEDIIPKVEKEKIEQPKEEHAVHEFIIEDPDSFDDEKDNINHIEDKVKEEKVEEIIKKDENQEDKKKHPKGKRFK